jgi:hypothetical protein
LPATINAAIIKPPRHQFAILIVAGFSSRLSRYTDDRTDERVGTSAEITIRLHALIEKVPTADIAL